jgi:hypothetical protein
MRNLIWLLPVLALGAPAPSALAQYGQPQNPLWPGSPRSSFRGYSPDPRQPGVYVPGAGLQTWFDEFLAPQQFDPGSRDLSDPSAPLRRLQGEMGRPPQFPPPGLNNPPQIDPELEKLLSPPQVDPEVLRKLEQTRTIPSVHFTQEKAVAIAPNDGLGSALRWIIPAILLGGAAAAGKLGARYNRTEDAS